MWSRCVCVCDAGECSGALPVAGEMQAGGSSSEDFNPDWWVLEFRHNQIIH